jgi:hypothetical protein
MVDMSFLPETCGGGHFLESTKIPNVGGVTTTAFVNKHNFGPSRCDTALNAHVKQQVFTRVAAAIGTDEGTIALINEGQEGRDMAWASEYKKENKVPDIDSYGL